MTAGSSAPGVPCRSSVNRWRTGPRDVEEVVVGVLGQPGAGAQAGVDRRAHGCRDRTACLIEGAPGRAVGGRPLQVTTPKPTLSTSRAAKSRNHAAYSCEWASLPGWAPPSRAHSSAYSAGSCESRLDDPRVEGGAGAGLLVEPLGPHVAPRATSRDLPVAEELRHATGLEHRADLADERPDEGVAGTAAVAVLVEREAFVARRDDERRVADDERELLSCDGVEQVTRDPARPRARHPHLLTRRARG